MAIIKCKMCGGDIVLSEDKTFGTCEYCGSTMTFPRVSDEQKLNLFNRANHFRRQNEFDKAIAAYDKILDQDDTDAEAHWGAVLSRYGIEYVEDPVSHERIPTCHRVQPSSILTDADYLAALQHAPDADSRALYEQEAHRIAEIQKGILAISAQEKPYDVFICYKESDDSGSRTVDSTLAQDIYYQLTNEGCKVFFSRITLEEKLGQQYEPYIFAALNSARVMLVIGTKPEYFNAVWVKNEWSRFLSLMKSDRSKLLIPCYRDMDPYDLPEALSALQSQDMSKIGFMQDIIRGVKKVLAKDEPKADAAPAADSAASKVTPLLKRAFMFLEDGEFDRADDFCEQVLNLDPENARAYLGKLMAELKVCTEAELKKCRQPFDRSGNYKKAVRFGDDALRVQLEEDIATINARNEYERKQRIFNDATRKLASAATVEAVDAARRQFQSIPDFEGVAEKLKACDERANEVQYKKAVRFIMQKDWAAAIEVFEQLGDYRDSREQVKQCRGCQALEAQKRQQEKEEQERRAEEERQRAKEEQERRAEQERQRAKEEQERRAEQERRREQERQQAEAQAAAEAAKRRRTGIIVAVVAVLAVAAAGVFFKVIQPKQKYNAAVALREAGRYTEAAAAFEALGDYGDAKAQIAATYNAQGDALLAAQDWSGAIAAYENAGNDEQAREARYQQADAFRDAGSYAEAYEIYAALTGYKDVDSIIESDENIAEAAYLAQFKVGNIVTFGAYEQDNNTFNGKEPIEWLVLENDGETAMLISQYELDYRQYNDKWISVRWKDCTLRKWLNGEFYNTAFSDEEKAMIEETALSDPDNPQYHTKGGEDTVDKVFLLSIEEVNTLFASDSDRQCKATAYVVANGAYVSSNGCTGWWLRSPGKSDVNVANVQPGGSVGLVGDYNNSTNTVRPVIVVRFS